MLTRTAKDAARRQTIPEGDLAALAALAVLEPRERMVAPIAWVSVGYAVLKDTHAKQGWYDYLDVYGVVSVVPGARWSWSNIRVPVWVNGLAMTVSAYAGTNFERRVIRLAKRAIRASARSPAFRAALAAKVTHHRDYTTSFKVLSEWLENRDWSDTRPPEVLVRRRKDS